MQFNALPLDGDVGAFNSELSSITVYQTVCVCRTLRAVETRPPGAAATLPVRRAALSSVVAVAQVNAVGTPRARRTRCR